MTGPDAARTPAHFPSGIGVSNALTGQRHCGVCGAPWPCPGSRDGTRVSLTATDDARLAAIRRRSADFDGFKTDGEAGFDRAILLRELDLREGDARAAGLREAPLYREALDDLLWWSEWMQREDRFTADLADTDEEANRRSLLMDTFRDHEQRALWLRALLAAPGAAPAEPAMEGERL